MFFLGAGKSLAAYIRPFLGMLVIDPTLKTSVFKTPQVLGGMATTPSQEMLIKNAINGSLSLTPPIRGGLPCGNQWHWQELQRLQAKGGWSNQTWQLFFTISISYTPQGAKAREVMASLIQTTTFLTVWVITFKDLGVRAVAAPMTTNPWTWESKGAKGCPRYKDLHLTRLGCAKKCHISTFQSTSSDQGAMLKASLVCL